MPSIRRVMSTLAFMSLASTAALWAHPHVFIDSRLEFEVRGKDCVGIWVEWTFDPVFSADVIGQFDKNHDGIFDQTENETVQSKAFSNLKKYGYFTFLRKGETRSFPEAVESFQASQRDGRAIYRFRVPLEGKGFSGNFSVATFDSTFYCASRYAETPASITWIGEKKPITPRIEVAANKKYPVYYNPMGGSGDTRVYLKWEKGLETAYPEEILVSLD